MPRAGHLVVLALLTWPAEAGEGQVELEVGPFLAVDNCPGADGVRFGKTCDAPSALYSTRCCVVDLPDTCAQSVCNPTFIPNGKAATHAQAERECTSRQQRLCTADESDDRCAASGSRR